MTAIGAHQLDDVHQRGEVVAVVLQRLLHRLAHRLIGGKVDHRVEVVSLEELRSQTLLVTAIDLNERDIDARDLADALDAAHVTV